MKRMLSFVLTVVTCFSLFPNVTLADQNPTRASSNEKTSVSESVYRTDAQSPVSNSVYDLFGEIAEDGEILSKRTRNSKTFLLPDGTYKAVMFQNDVHYEDAEGKFQDIKTELTDENDLDLNDVKLSKELHKDAVKIRKMQLNKKVNQNDGNYRSAKMPFDASLPKNYAKGYSITKGSDSLTFIPVGASNSGLTP